MHPPPPARRASPSRAPRRRRRRHGGGVRALVRRRWGDPRHRCPRAPAGDRRGLPEHCRCGDQACTARGPRGGPAVHGGERRRACRRRPDPDPRGPHHHRSRSRGDRPGTGGLEAGRPRCAAPGHAGTRTDPAGEIGGLDPELPTPWAEIDLCRRIWRSGERVAVQASSRVLTRIPPDRCSNGCRSSAPGSSWRCSSTAASRTHCSPSCCCCRWRRSCACSARSPRPPPGQL